MSEEKKPTKWLLVGIPQDTIDLVRDYQTTEMKKCNCRFGIKKSIVSLLRKAYPDGKYCKLPDATAGKS